MCDKENCNCGSNPYCGDCEPWNCVEQAVNDVWATKEDQIEGLVDRAETAAENSEASAKASAESAAEAKEFRDEAETAATTAVAAEGVVLGVANTLQDTADKLKQIADELGTAIAGISVVTWYYTTVSDDQTIIPVPLEKNEVDVQAIYIEGGRQEPNRGFSYDKLNREITLAQPLPKGMEISIIIGTYSDNPNDFANTLASNNGASLVGTTSGKTVQAELNEIDADLAGLDRTLRADLAKPTGSDLVGFKSNLAGAITRSVYYKLLERVSVLDFGADPTGVKDSSQAFQVAMDLAYIVDAPAGKYRLDSSLLAKHSVTIQGEGNPGVINRAMTFINMNGNIPFISNWQAVGNANSMFQLHVKRLFIQYNPVTRPEVTEDNSNKIAFNIYSTTPEANGLEFSSFEDIVVLGGWAAFWDRAGTYMSKLTRVEARKCRYGFLKATGTTIILENCYATECLTPYQFGALSTLKMTACAMDNSAISLSNGSLGGAGLHITNVRCFSIDIFDAEVNRVAADGGGIASLIHIENSVGTVNGLVGLHNDLVSEGATPTGTVAKYRLSDNSIVSFIGCEDEFFRDQRSQYKGSGYGITVLTDATSRAVMRECRMKDPAAAEGSTPLLLALSQGNVLWENCDKAGLIVSGGMTINHSNGALITDAVLTDRNQTAVTANTATKLFTLPSEGAYTFNVYASGSGANYMASGHIIYDGSSVAITKVTPGAFINLSAVGADIQVTSQGSTTLKWSYLKVA